MFSKPFRGRYDQAYSDYEESMIGSSSIQETHFELALKRRGESGYGERTKK